MTGYPGPPALVSLHIIATGTAGSFVHNVKLYRQGDEDDLNDGLIFRRPFKQEFVNLNPAAIRFMNWHGGAGFGCRFENRMKPAAAGYSQSDWTISPPYGETSGTNQMTLASAAGMPASMLHGEVVTCRIGGHGGGTGIVRCGAKPSSNRITVTAIQNGPNAQVTAPDHGFSSNDWISHNIVGMPRLNFLPVQIQVTGTDTYTIGIDTSDTPTWGIFVPTPAASQAGEPGYATQYISLNVGGRGDYPVVFPSSVQLGGYWGDRYILTSDYKTFVFNMTVAAKKDGSGNWIYGVWYFRGIGTNLGYDNGQPLEICVALINELNVMSVAQGITNPIHMWINMPVASLSSMDPDYSTNSEYALNALDVIFNGANGHAGLTSAAWVILEYGNETFNWGTFSQTYCTWRGMLRWGLADPLTRDANLSALRNNVDMAVLRSTVMMAAVKAAYPPSSSPGKRIICSLGMWDINGFATRGNLTNRQRCFGNSSTGQYGNWYTTDTQGGVALGQPISHYDSIHLAPYLDPPSPPAVTGLYNYFLSGQYVTDVANYKSGDAVLMANAISSFVEAVSVRHDVASNSTIAAAIARDAQFASGMAELGKVAIQYEGGANWPCDVGDRNPFGTINFDQSAFLTAVINSTQWRDAQLGFFDSFTGQAGAAMPAIYLTMGNNGQQRWAYAKGDTYAGGVEGQALANNPCWAAMCARNRALPA